MIAAAMKRGPLAVMVLLCFAGAMGLLYLGQHAYFLNYDNVADEMALLRYLLYIDRSGGVLRQWNVDDYVEHREADIAEALVYFGLAVLLIWRGTCLLQGLRGRMVAEGIGRWLRGAVAGCAAFLGVLLGAFAFVCCASMEMTQAADAKPYVFVASDAANVAQTGLLALLCLIYAGLLLPVRWLVWGPLLALGLAVGIEAAMAEKGRMCVSPHGGMPWVLRVGGPP